MNSIDHVVTNGNGGLANSNNSSDLSSSLGSVSSVGNSIAAASSNQSIPPTPSPAATPVSMPTVLTSSSAVASSSSSSVTVLGSSSSTAAAMSNSSPSPALQVSKTNYAMGLQHILERLHSFQGELCHKCHFSVDSALMLALGVNGPLWLLFPLISVRAM